MKIVIEKTGRSFFLHALHWVVFGLYVYQTIDQSLTTGQFLTSLNCVIWISIAYVRFLQLTASEAKLQMLETDIARDIVGGFEQFMRDNKDELIGDIKDLKKGKKSVKIKDEDEKSN
jgi:hypothetical protein